jgi:hypothetical protein
MFGIALIACLVVIYGIGLDLNEGFGIQRLFQ